MTKCMNRVTFVFGAAGQVYKQTDEFVYLGAIVCKDGDLTVEMCYWPIYASKGMARHYTTCLLYTSDAADE